MGKDNIRLHSRTEGRYRCRVCGRTFVARQGTPFYRLRTADTTVTRVVTLLAYGCPAEGLSTGLFIDMRTVRAWLREQAKGHTILNCFAYTCGFGLAGLAGGAARVVNLDVSKRYLDWGKRNYLLNGLSAPDTDFIFGDVFDWLKRFTRSGQQFDLVVLDPPSYATTRQTRFSLARDYAGLVALAAPVVKTGGRLLACANTHTLARKTFLAQIRRGVPEFGATVLKVEHEPDLDFPVAPGPGSEPYLKAAWVNVSSERGEKRPAAV